MNTPPQKDGGCAFQHYHADNDHSARGLSVRQYYKAAALQGLLASGMLATKPRQMEMAEMCEGIISSAAEFADHMIAEDEEHDKK